MSEECKVTLVGQPGSGKTSLALRYKGGAFPQPDRNDNGILPLTIDNIYYNVIIWSDSEREKAFELSISFLPLLR